MIMGNVLYSLALVILVFWAIGFFAYGIGGLIHVLLVIAIIAIILRLILGKKV